MIADLLIQTLGLVAFLIPPVILIWAWRIVSSHRLPRWWLRLAALPFVLVFCAMALATLPPPGGWLPRTTLGGSLGQLALGHTAALTQISYAMIATAALVLGLASLALCLGLSRAEWRGLGAALLRLVSGAQRGLKDAAQQAEQAGRKRKRARQAEAAREPRIAQPGTARSRAGAEETGGSDKASAPRVAAKAKPKQGKKARQASQRRLDLGPSGEYQTPPLELLEAPPEGARDSALSKDALEKNAQLLEGVLEDFGVRGEIVKIRPGPVVTRYDLEPAPGTKTSRVVGLADDIARSLSAISVRVAVVPGSSAIGIELPNAKREVVYLRELLGAAAFERSGAKLALAMGKDIGGQPIIADLARMPHLLVAGTTGSGKSVAINAMILSLLYRLGPERCKCIMIDPKMLELSVYEGIPHLLAPVVTEPKKAVVALKWTVREMEERYRAMSRLGVRNMEGYNARVEEARRKGEVLTRKVQTGFDPDTGQPITEEEPFDLVALPFIVVVVDEMADLMLVAGKDVEGAIQRLAQMARAAGIHLIMATQSAPRSTSSPAPSRPISQPGCLSTSPPRSTAAPSWVNRAPNSCSARATCSTWPRAAGSRGSTGPW